MAGRIREETPRKQLQDLPGGEVMKTFYMAPDRPRWLYTHIARFGPHAEVMSPPDVREGMAVFLDDILGAGETRAARPMPARRRSAAAVSRPKRPRTRRKPSS